MRSDYINDGYTEEGFIAAVPGLHGELRFKYRPFLVEEEFVLSTAAEKMDPAKGHRAYVSAIAARLVEWSLADRNGKTVEIAAASVGKLCIPLWYRLKTIMRGLGPLDIDPSATDQQKEESADLALTAILEGKPIGQLTEEANEKN